MQYPHTKAVRLSLLVLLICAAFAVVGGVTAQSSGEKVLTTGINQVGGDPETLDPNLAQASQELAVIQEMFPGLTVQDTATGDLKPGIASSWDVSADGKTYTYHLIQNIPWVHWNSQTNQVEQVKDSSGNPKYVTASDLVYSWQRVLDPKTASPYAYVPADFVVGGDDVENGKADPSTLAVKAVDDWTFQVTAPDAVSFIPNIDGLWPTDPVPQDAIEQYGDQWTEPGNMESYGPFVLSDWQHDASITLVKNPFWPGITTVPQPKLDKIVYTLLDPAGQFANFQAGTLDASAVPVEQIDAIKADATLSKEYYVGTSPCTYYVGFNVTQPVVSDVHLRRAISFAVDRQSIVDNVTKGGQVPAQWFARPGLLAAPTLDSNPDLGIKYDPDQAKSELTLALKDLGYSSAADVPAITLAYNDSSGHAAIMAAIQQQVKDTLGLNLQLSAREPTTYFSSLENGGSPQMWRAGWCQDYPDADDFDRVVFRSDSTQNNALFKSADFDKLVDQARAETDTAKRQALYAQAEDILVNQQAAIIPIYWYTTLELTKSNIERTYSVTGQEEYATWDIGS
ncbi:MAG TPA: peptide ABC transporter substrate-binding protein [Phototrophicaceae bacterium]|nr:peptide ABC transporter substrate-binding protein [Phototrophicaceae bacterium]